MELIDIGCNLTHDSFDDDLESVLEKARTAGVAQFIVTGASHEGSQKAYEMATAFPGEIYSTAGVHPHRADTFEEATEALVRELARHDQVVAIGETGLDYFRDFSPRDVQKGVLRRHIEIAAETGLPMFLHLRDAHEDFHGILSDARDRLTDVVVHCFTGSRDELRAYIELDCHIGITGWICDERRGTHMKEYLSDIPADRLMIETDAPYLKPRNLRPLVKSHRNEPRFLPWILGTLAAARNEHPEWLAERTTENARRFFRIPRN
ncbi:MAG: hydrolase TatD [Xanthomonadales bacterium]|nr:TatD family hydrolase [Gammaproteobacteria bacterium]MBT8051838.1 TatD family hydrolase [Gammaproteobacteria bacterium]MBT8057823.1 TatD family hydrolase [Gammaproteobacteria bacterium]NNJ77832.1 hydrolase TatD [Xanthomonadales bacterium]NNL04629.1 hydrolase TatD [Xanthomonadales bacterium]